MVKTSWQTLATWAMGERGDQRGRMTHTQIRAFTAYLITHPMAYNPAGVFHNRATGRARLAMGVVKDDDNIVTWNSTEMEQARP